MQNLITALIALLFLETLNAKPSGSKSKLPSYMTDERTPEVFVTKLEEQEIFDQVVFGGFIRAKNAMPAAPEVDGTIQSYLVEPGAKVQKGDLLYKVKPRGSDAKFHSHLVKSPIAGVVTRKTQNVGDFVKTGDPGMYVASLKEQVISFGLSYTDASLLKKGAQATVEISAPGKPTETESGVVTYISPDSDPETGSYRGELSLNCHSSCSPAFRLGAFARIFVKQNFRLGFRVPIKALKENRTTAFIVKEDDTVDVLKVETGDSDGITVEVTSGFTPGMRLITQYSRRPKQGQKVLIRDIREETERAMRPSEH